MIPFTPFASNYYFHVYGVSKSSEIANVDDYYISSVEKRIADSIDIWRKAVRDVAKIAQTRREPKPALIARFSTQVGNVRWYAMQLHHLRLVR